MKYFLHLMGQKIKYYWKYYIILVIQLSIGLAFVSYSLNHFLASREMLEIMEESVLEGDVRIYMSTSVDTGVGDDPPVTFEEYEYIKKEMRGAAVLSICQEAPDNGGTDGVQYYVYTDVQNLLGRKAHGGQDYIAAIDNGRFILASQCGIFPLEEFETAEQVGDYNLTIHVEEGNISEEELQKVLLMLQESHGSNYQYYLNNPMAEQQYLSEYVTLIPTYLGKLAIVMMLVLVFGFSGILYLYVKRREKGFAVCCAMGVGQKRLCLEILGEIAVICSAGVLAGNVLCRIIMGYKVYDDLFDIRYYGTTVLITVIITMLITAAVAVVPILRIRKMKPIELLQSL